MSLDDHSSAIAESKQYVDDIMDNIESLLSSNDISFTTNGKRTEIIINRNDSNINKDYIKSLIKESLDIPKPVLSLLIGVKSTKTDIYIRQRKK